MSIAAYFFQLFGCRAVGCCLSLALRSSGMQCAKARIKTHSYAPMKQMNARRQWISWRMLDLCRGSNAAQNSAITRSASCLVSIGAAWIVLLVHLHLHQ
jgi:hypothetical protein